jgi:3-deoxy-D-manno-octulosonic-acid transferase
LKAETAGKIGKIVLSILGRTWRTNRLRPSTGLQGSHVLYGFWHGVQLPLLYTHRNMGISIVISQSSDGDIVSAVCEVMGYRPVRGSSSRGGLEAARELIRRLRTGTPGAITPDGPRGPARQVKKGITLVPEKAEVPVVPYGAWASPAIRLKSWDGFMIPLPFARLCIAEGLPVLPEFCTAEALTAAINSRQALAEMMVSRASMQASAARAAGAALHPAAALVLMARNRNERRERLGYAPVRHDRPAWLHGASLGELKGLAPVLDALREADIPVFLTCTTSAGREFIENSGVPGSFLPIDTPAAVERFLSRVKPSRLFLAETEFWPVLLHSVVKAGIPACLVNGRLSMKSLSGYRAVKSLFGGIFGSFRVVFTRTPEDTERFQELGVKAVTAGDFKCFVKARPPEESWKGMIRRGSNGILVAGSTRRGEERTVLQVALKAGMTPVMVPRHTERTGEVADICRAMGLSPGIWSNNPVDSDCLVVDARGVLASLYGLADVAFVGGTLVPLGGHNVLEPAAHGVPVIVGPHHESFAVEIEEMKKRGACMVFSNADQGAEAALNLSGSRCLDGSVPSSGPILDKLMELMEVRRATC